MTKHIVGLIIFTLIVGTSVVVASLFGASHAPKTYNCDKYNVKHKVYKKKKRKKKRRHEKRHKRGHYAANMTQAIFDKGSNQLTTSLDFKNESFEGVVDFHFFVKDEFGTQYLKKETIKASSTQSVYENSFSWLNRLESRENLYVMPIAIYSNRNLDYQPRFDVSRATPVLLKMAE